MRDQIINSLINKKILMAEIKAKQREFDRIQDQITKLEQSKKDIITDIKKKIDEIDSIGEWLSDIEYNDLMNTKKM